MPKTGRQPKDKKKMTLKLKMDIRSKLEEHSKDTGMSMTEIIEVAVDKYIDQANKDAEILRRIRGATSGKPTGDN